MVLLNSFFRANSYNPDLPAETWTLVFAKETGGSYNTTLGWGKYKFEMSGGGGSGGAASRRSGISSSSASASSGGAGYKTSGSFKIYNSETKYINGVVGTGATGNRVDYNGTNTLGQAGTGEHNGVRGTMTAKEAYEGFSSSYPDFFSRASGSGGGSSSLYIAGAKISEASGGQGGKATTQVGTHTGGLGGNNGGLSGTGVSGGGSAAGSGTQISAGGATGYIKIWKSNLRPEDA